jgi:hypothetical protein
MKNLSLPPLLLVARAPLPPVERPRRSRRAINASSPLYRVTGPIRVVSPLSYLVLSLLTLTRMHLGAYPSLPAKCVHRKTRCTYVKFHRQTAPLGPGHPARPPHDASNPAHPPLGALLSGPSQYRLSDPFFLPGSGPALNPSAISQSTTSGPNNIYADHQFTFPPPLQPSYDSAFDYAARYRAQADLLSRAGVIPQERAPAIYQDSHVPQDPNNVARYPQPYHLRNDPQDYPLPPSPNGVDYGYNIDNKVCSIYDSSPHRLTHKPQDRIIPEQRLELSDKRIQPSPADVQS